MIYGCCFSIICLVFITMFSVIYFSKKRINSLENKIYSLLIENNIIVLNFTTNPEELLYSKQIIKKDFSVCSVNEITDVKIVDLCDRLINYGILKEKSIDMDEVIFNL